MQDLSTEVRSSVATRRRRPPGDTCACLGLSTDRLRTSSAASGGDVVLLVLAPFAWGRVTRGSREDPRVLAPFVWGRVARGSREDPRVVAPLAVGRGVLAMNFRSVGAATACTLRET